MKLLIIVILIVVIIVTLLHYIVVKESLYDFNYINNIRLQRELNNKEHPQTLNIDSHDDYNAATYSDELIEQAKDAMLDSNHSDSLMALHRCHTGKQLRRMLDHKNELVKVDRKYLFEEEMNTDQNRDWWEEQKNFDITFLEK